MEAPASAEAETAVLDGLGEGSWGCGRDLGWAEESLSLRPEVEVVWVRWGGEVRVVERSRSCPGIPSAQHRWIRRDPDTALDPSLTCTLLVAIHHPLDLLLLHLRSTMRNNRPWRLGRPESRGRSIRRSRRR